MPSGGKISEAGWFYHAPAKPKQIVEPVAVPPASQIPGLSDLADQPYVEPQRVLLKESDSPYIRMAKTGGRPDLLRYRSPKPKPDEPVGYPRVDWFYLDDNAMEDQEKKDEDYCFMLPDYMVHHASDKKKGSANGTPYTPNRLPYAFDKETVYEREGRQASDKRVALPESRPTGYGVRAEKQHGKPVKYPMVQQERGKAPESQLDKGKQKIKPMCANETDKPIMGKILAYGYARDWEDDREKWASKQKPQKKDKFEVTEYQSSMMAGTPPVRSAQGQRVSSSSSNRSRKQISESKKESKDSKNKSNSEELFKLSKFNVAAPTDHSVQTFLGSKMSMPWNQGEPEPTRTGRRKYDVQMQKSSEPYATGYPETRDETDTPSKRPGRRIVKENTQQDPPFAQTTESPFQKQEPNDDQIVNNSTPARAKPIRPVDNSNVFSYNADEPDNAPSQRPGRRICHQSTAASEAPYAKSTESMFPKQEAKVQEQAPAPANNAAPARAMPVKPADNSNVFRYDKDAPADSPSKTSGRRRFEGHNKQSAAPFATDDGVDRNGTGTPRSAGRRKYDDQMQQKPAPFAMDDGKDRFKNVPAKTNTNRGNGSEGAAGLARSTRNVPPPNSSGAGIENRSSITTSPYAVN